MDIANIFHEDDSDDGILGAPVKVDVAGLSVYLTTAESDHNKDRKTLFATHIWTGSRIIAEYCVKCVVVGKSVLELGKSAAPFQAVCDR